MTDLFSNRGHFVDDLAIYSPASRHNDILHPAYEAVC